MWGICPDAVKRVPLNADVNHVHYSLNHGTKLATNYVEVGYPLKVVPVGFMLVIIKSNTTLSSVATT